MRDAAGDSGSAGDLVARDKNLDSFHFDALSVIFVKKSVNGLIDSHKL